MLIKTKYIDCASKSIFNKWKLPTSASDVDKDIYWSAIVFIKDTGEIWTHGKLYGGLFSNADNNKVSLAIGGTQKILALDGHVQSYNTLTGSGTIADQVILSTGESNKWTLKTLGKNAFSNENYLPLDATAIASEKVVHPITFKYNENNMYSFDGSESKILNFKQGDNVTITGDSQGNITISSDPGTNTVNTAGATNLINKKLFLIGAESQTASPKTYSNESVYIGTDNCLYSGEKKVLTDHQSIYGLDIQTLINSVTTKISSYDPKSSSNSFTLVQGTNVTLTPDVTNKRVTIASKDTTYSFFDLQFKNGTVLIDTYKPTTSPTKILTAGTNVSFTLTNGEVVIASVDTRNTTGTTNRPNVKMYLVGADIQEDESNTYSNNFTFIGTDNCLYSLGKKVLTEHQTIYNLDLQTQIGEAITKVTSFDPNAADNSFTLVQGNNITLTPDATNKKITISGRDTTYDFYNLIFKQGDTIVDTYKPATSPNKTIKAGSNITIFKDTSDIIISSSYIDTLNTAGSTNKSDSKLYLIGALSQSNNPQTYSNANVYIGTNNKLYSNNLEVSTIDHTHAYLPLAGGTITGELTLSIAGLNADNFIKFKNDNQICYFGIRNPYDSSGLTFVSPNGTYNKVWHSANDGNGSGLDADLLDGIHGSGFARANEVSSNYNIGNLNGIGILSNPANANATVTNQYPVEEAGTLFYGTAAYGSSNQLYGTYNSNRWFVRGGGASPTSKTPWIELAKTDWVSTYYLPLTGGTMTGGITITTDSAVMWSRNTDYAKIYFKNTGDGDVDSYLGFEIGDNGDEYFRFAGGITEWASIKSDGIRSTSFIKKGSSNSYALLGGGEHMLISTSSSANSIVQRDTNGYIYSSYINTSIGDEDSTSIGSVYIRNTSDNWIRKMSWGTFVGKVNDAHSHGLFNSNFAITQDTIANTNFRAQVFGTTSFGAGFRVVRWNNVPAILSGLGQYGTGLFWANSDTQGFLALNYYSAGAKIGGGDGNNINWTATLWHSENFNPSNYLPLTGGTITGQLQLSNTSIYLDHQGLRSWIITAYNTGGNLAISSGDRVGGLDFNGNTVWHSGNDGSGSGLDADLLDGRHLKSIIGFDTKRDFINGTLITTNIDYSASEGDPFYLEIKGNTYTRWYPCLTQAQGYIYNNTIINYGVTHVGYIGIYGLVALNVNGNLCFWFPRQGYWEGYSIFVSSAFATSYNRVTAIDDVVKPTGTKEVIISEHTTTSAYTDSNVASATKLQTPRSIWGQNFNGEGNVSGALSGATTGSFSSHVKIGGGTVNLGGAWDGGIIAGADGHDKIVATYLTSSTNAATIGAHNSGLTAWSKLNIAGTSIQFSINETPKMTLDSGGNLGVTGTVTAQNGIITDYEGSHWLSMATRVNQIRGDVNATTNSAHSLYCVKNSNGDAIAFGGLGVNTGFYGFTAARITNGTNGTDWSTSWDVSTGMLNHTGSFYTSGYIAAGNRIFTGYDSGTVNSISCSNWFRSNGATGWYNETYGGGITMIDSTYVRVHNNKAFKVTSTASDSINTVGGVTAANFYGNINASYLTGTIANERLPQRLCNYTSQYSVDPNTFKESGFAYTSMTANLPANVSDANILSVSHTSGGWGHQLAFKFGGTGIGGSGHDGKDIYTRLYNSSTGAWTSWYGLLSTGNYSNVLDSRYRPMRGSWAGNSVPGTREFGFTTNDGSGEVAFKSNSGTMNMIIDGNIYVTDNSYQVIHAGNIASQSVSYASSSGNADTVDSLHQTSFLRCDSASSSNVLNGNFAIGNASGRNFIQSHNSQPLDLNPLGNLVTVNSYSVWHAGNDGAGSGLDADLVDGLHIHSNRNNEADKIVRTDSNGYLQCGYINSSSGNENNNYSPDRIWGSNSSDGYLRTYRTSALNVGNADTLDGRHSSDLVFAPSDFYNGTGNNDYNTSDYTTWFNWMVSRGGISGRASITTGNWWWSGAIVYNSSVGSINTSGAMIIHAGNNSNSDKNYKHFLVLDAYSNLYGITSNEESWKMVRRFATTDDLTNYSLNTHNHNYGSLSNLIVAGNEHNWVYAGFNGSMWLNYQDKDNRNSSSIISEYYMGNCRGGYANVHAATFYGSFSGNGAIPIGGIIMWSGSIDTIPSGWTLCNGSNGTPDLRDRFVMGASTWLAPGDTGGSNTTYLTAKQLPSHSHAYTTTSDDDNNGFTFTGDDGVSKYYNRYGNRLSYQGNGSDGNNNSTGLYKTSYTGSGYAIENRPAYYALAFIMRIS